MEVDDDAVRPAGEPSQMRSLEAAGWDTLELDRGIPFMSAQSMRPRGTAGPGGHAADGRRSLLLQASDQAVAIVYSVDPALNAGGSDFAASVRRALVEAASGLKTGDSIGVVAADGSWASALQPVGDGKLADGISDALASMPKGQGGALSPALRSALAAPGATHVVVIASAEGGLSADDEGWFAEQSAAKGRPRVIALVVGDGKTTPRAEALRDLALGASGAFAWLKPIDR